MTYARMIALALAPVILAACGGGGSGDSAGGGVGSVGGGGGIVDTPPIPTTEKSILEITQSRNAAAYAVPIPGSPATGSGNFAGGLLADATVNGEAGHVLFANVDASANLFDGTFSGTIRNINLADTALNPTEGINGQLTFNGGSNGITKTVAATARGNLVGNFGGDTTETVNMAINLNGRVRGPDLFNNMETLNGAVSGGSIANQPYDIDLDGDFYISQEFAPD